MENYTPEDLVRETLRTHGPLTREEIFNILGTDNKLIRGAISILAMHGELLEDAEHRLYLEEHFHRSDNAGSCRSDPSIYGGIEQVWEMEKLIKRSLTNLDSPACDTRGAPTPTEISNEAAKGPDMTNYTAENLVREVIREHGPIRRTELMDRTGLLTVSLELVIDRLVKRGEVIQNEGWFSLAWASNPPASESHLGKQGLPSASALPSVSDIEKLYPHRFSDDAAEAVNRLIDRNVVLEAKCKDYDALLADREALHALRAKLREMGKEE